jgi:hypothetical protein
MRLAQLSAAAIVSFAVVAFVACASETITLATIPDTEAGAPPVPTRCLVSMDCDAGYYCAKTTCAAQSGTCTLPPLSCDTAPEGPVCGCDNVTYFSNCLAEQNGAPSYTDGECLQNPVLCGGPNPQCPGNAICAQLFDLPGDYDHCEGPGRCWVIPAQCPTAPSTDRWSSCDPLGSVCLDTCTAITMGGAYHGDPMCPH